MIISNEERAAIVAEVRLQLKSEWELERKHLEKEEHDKRLRNTEILLVNYKKLKAHVDTNPERFITADEYETYTGVKLTNHELPKYKIKTQHLLHYVDMILHAYSSYCLGGDDSEQRRWSILYNTYLAEHRLKDNTMKVDWQVDRSTISRERRKAIQDLSVMLFGVAGLSDFLAHWIS